VIGRDQGAIGAKVQTFYDSFFPGLDMRPGYSEHEADVLTTPRSSWSGRCFYYKTIS